MSVYAAFRGERVPHLKIIPHRRWWFMLSGAIMLASLAGLLAGALHLSIDFKGGASFTYPMNRQLAVADVQATMGQFGRGDAVVQIVNGDTIVVRTGTLASLGDRRAPLLDALAKQAGIKVDEINVNDIGPSWGKQISKRMLLALVIFLVVVSVYIASRFEWKMAAGALIALVHDVVITAGVYVLVGREVTPETVIAILTILGFSLYDTVVIYDKVEENTATAALIGKRSYGEVVNTSMNQVIMRSINTSLVVLFPILSLLLFGGETLRDFAFALFVGVLTGTYSSIFVAAPVLVVLKEIEPKYRTAKLRAAADEKAIASADPSERTTVDAAAARLSSGSATRGSVVVPPRPRKKKSAAKRKKR